MCSANGSKSPGIPCPIIRPNQSTNSQNIFSYFVLIYLIHTNHSSIIYCLSKNYKCHLVYVFQLKPINDWVEFFKSFI